MYAMVDASDYQKVATIASDEGFENLKKKFLAIEGNASISKDDVKTKDITIETVQILSVEDTTKCFLTDTENNRYKFTITDENEDVAAFLKPQDVVNITYTEQEEVNLIQSIERK